MILSNLHRLHVVDVKKAVVTGLHSPVTTRYHWEVLFMKRAKVLHIIGGGDFGGAEQHLLTLLKNIDGGRFQVSVACLFAKPFALLAKEAGISTVVFDMGSKLNLKIILALAAHIKKEGIDIVHTHGVRANLIGRLAAKIAGVDHVLTTVHSVLAFDYARKLDRMVNWLSERLTRGLTAHFVTVCDLLAGQLVGEGIKQDRVSTIYNGLELEKYSRSNDPGNIRAELHIPEAAPLIGIVARLHPVKGHVFLLQAVKQALAAVPGLKLLIVGSGPDRQELEHYAGALGIADAVIFTGFRQDIPEVMHMLDLVVLSSLSEGLSITIIEAMAIGKPVLATRVGGTPEIITDGQDGLLVPPADAGALADKIIYILSHPDMAKKMGQAARLTVQEKFTAAGMARKTEALYAEMLGV